jgi:hypothetical protein
VSISTKTVGVAGNDAKFLTSSRSSAHIPNNFWSWIISSQTKEGREDKDSTSAHIVWHPKLHWHKGIGSELTKVKYKATLLATKHKLSSNENKIKSNIIGNMAYIKTVSIYKFGP